MKTQIKSQMLSFAAEAPPSPLFILGTYDSTFTNLAIDVSESASLLPGRTVAPCVSLLLTEARLRDIVGGKIPK